MILPLILALAINTITTTPSITTITPTPTTTPNDVLLLIKQKVQERLKQINSPTSTKKAIVGKVIQVDNSTVTVEYQNSTRKITLGTDTVYISNTGSKITLDKIKIGQDIIAMGINQIDTNIFEAKRIVITDLKKVIFVRTIVAGKIVDISRTSPVFTLISSKNKNSLFQIKTDPKTDIIDKTQQKIKITDIKAGQKMIAILTPDIKTSKTYYALKLVDLDYTPAIPSPTPTKKP